MLKNTSTRPHPCSYGASGDSAGFSLWLGTVALKPIPFVI